MMSLLARLLSLFRNVLQRHRVERELDDEMHASLEWLTDEHLRAGKSVEAARRSAMLELGPIESVKEHVRAARAGALIEALGQDLHYGTRILFRNPLFTLTAAISIAIGVAAPTTIFTVSNGLLLRSAAGVHDPGAIVDVVRSEGSGPGVSPIAYPDYVEISRRTTTLQDVHASELLLEPSSLRVGESGAERAFATAVSTNYFQALGIAPATGRLFVRADSEQPGASPYVVLSHRFWLRRFSRDPAVVGQLIRINGHPLTVVGVAAEGFRGTSVAAPDLWIPLGMVAAIKPDGAQLLTGRQSGWLLVSGRLAEGASRGQASAEMAAIGAALAREYPLASQPPAAAMEGLVAKAWANVVWSVQTSSPIPYGLRTIVAGFLTLLMVVVSMVLVIACGNIAGVLLARATTRRLEMAIRVSSGAARGRLIRQLVTETFVLFLIGGTAGLVLARALTSLLVLLLPAFPVPVDLSVPLDHRVVMFSLAVSLAAAVAAGLAPALDASKSDVVSVLRGDAHGAPERLRLRHAFVVAQVAFSLLLVVTAGLFVRALQDVRDGISLGFDATGVDAATLDLTLAGYNEATGSQFARELIRGVASLPAVRGATLADRAPGSGAMMLGGVSIPGVAPPPGFTHFSLNGTIVSPGYFATLSIPLVEGRDFSDDDRQGAEPVVILGQRAVERFWPGRTGVGQFILLHPFGPAAMNAAPVQMRVIGVVKDVSAGARPEMYVPLQQRHSAKLAILAKRDPARSLAGDLRGLVAAMNPNLPLLSNQTLETLYAGPVEAQLRIAAAVAGAVGSVGLLLAGIGIYGVTAYAVARRTREIGIRLSLGAQTRDVVRFVLRHSMMLIGLGLAIGLALSAGAGRLVMGRGFGPGVNVPASDLPTLVVAVLAFVAVGLAACYVPVRRATRIQATEALRYE